MPYPSQHGDQVAATFTQGAWLGCAMRHDRASWFMARTSQPGVGLVGATRRAAKPAGTVQPWPPPSTVRSTRCGEFCVRKASACNGSVLGASAPTKSLRPKRRTSWGCISIHPRRPWLSRRLKAEHSSPGAQDRLRRNRTTANRARLQEHLQTPWHAQLFAALKVATERSKRDHSTQKTGAVPPVYGPSGGGLPCRQELHVILDNYCTHKKCDACWPASQCPFPLHSHLASG